MKMYSTRLAFIFALSIIYSICSYSAHAANIRIIDTQEQPLENAAVRISAKDDIISLPTLIEDTAATIWHPLMSDDSNQIKKIILSAKQLTQEDTITITLDVTPVADKKGNSFKDRFKRNKKTDGYDN